MVERNYYLNVFTTRQPIHEIFLYLRKILETTGLVQIKDALIRIFIALPFHTTPTPVERRCINLITLLLLYIPPFFSIFWCEKKNMNEGQFDHDAWANKMKFST